MANGLFYEIGLFKNVSESCLQTVLENSRILEVEAGHVFFSAGQTGKELFLLEKGSVQIFRDLRHRRIVISTLRLPSVLRETGCILLGAQYFSAESVQDSIARLISNET